MKLTNSKEVIVAGLFVCIGIILPMAFHVAGPGTVFLPMHIPVLLSGFVLSLPYAILVGLITPVLSSILTGMPPLFPVLPYMIIELVFYSSGVFMFYRIFEQSIYGSLLMAMITGRIATMSIVWILINITIVKLPDPFVFISGATIVGLPGILIQLLLIPPIVIVLKKRNLV